MCDTVSISNSSPVVSSEVQRPGEQEDIGVNKELATKVSSSTDLKNIEEIEKGNIGNLEEGSKAKSIVLKILAGIGFAAGIALTAVAIIASAGVGGAVGAIAAAVVSALSGTGGTLGMASLGGITGALLLMIDKFEQIDAREAAEKARIEIENRQHMEIYLNNHKDDEVADDSDKISELNVSSKVEEEDPDEKEKIIFFG